jgi:hypothetical protein
VAGIGIPARSSGVHKSEIPAAAEAEEERKALREKRWIGMG